MNILLEKVNKLFTKKQTQKVPSTPPDFIINVLNSSVIKSAFLKQLNSKSLNTITYKWRVFMPSTFTLVTLTLLTIQYQNENFSIQMSKMQDSCAESYGYFNENQTYILDTLFPYGFSSALSFDDLYNQLKIIDEIHKKQSINNITIKYLSQSECKAKNYTSLINMITVPSSVRNINSQKYRLKQQFYYKIPMTNIILVCDDESYKKSLLNSIQSASLISPLAFESQFENDLSAMDLLDFQTNVISQVKKYI